MWVAGCVLSVQRAEGEVPCPPPPPKGFGGQLWLIGWHVAQSNFGRKSSPRAEEVGHAFINVRNHVPFTAVNYIPHWIPECHLLTEKLKCID